MPTSIPSLDKEQVAENNPLPPVPPSDGITPELHGFLKDFVATVRSAHTSNQLGDSTFNWQVMLAVDDVAQYNLGSQGSFYHPIYGTFTGNYVQFDSMDAAGIVGGPVGFTKVSWVVTNIIGRTLDGIVQGLLCSETIPVSGTFGWILTKGVNIYQLTVSETVKRNDSLSWTPTGLQFDPDTTPFGQVMLITDGVIAPGDFLVKLVGASGAVLGRIAALEAQLDGLANAGLEDRLNEQLSLVQRNMDTSLLVMTKRIRSLTPDGSSITETQFLQSLTNFKNLASIASANAALAAKYTDVSLQATVEFTKQAKTGRDESKFYSEASGMFSVDAGLSASNASFNADASAGFSASASSFADDAGVHAAAALVSETNASVSEGNASASASASGGYASDASISESNAHAYSLVAASNMVDLAVVTATVATHSTAIADHTGKLTAWWNVTAIAGDNTASLEVLANNSGGRILLNAANVDIHGDLLVTGTITTPKLDAVAVTTPKIADQAVTNWVSATGFGGTIDATGGAGSMTMANATITTVGGVIKVDFQCNASKSGPSAVYRLEFYRDATLIGRTYHITPSGTGFEIPQSCFIIDSPAAGTYTYTAQFGTLSGGGSGSHLNIDNADIFIQEFKK